MNQNKKFRSFKSKENIHKDEDGPDCTVLNIEFSSVTLFNSPPETKHTAISILGFCWFSKMFNHCMYSFQSIT